MKIGLLTLTPTENYGGILQSVALYSYLTEQGHEVTLINKLPDHGVIKKIVIKTLEVLPFQNIKNKRKQLLKRKHLKPFIKKNMPNKSRAIFTKEDLTNLVEELRFDTVIVGSDQVWRYEYINDGSYTVFFLDFQVCFPVKKIAYAASFGKCEWEAPSEVRRVARLLEDFNAISTREKNGVDICNDTFGVDNAQFVLDPTLLVEQSFYERFNLNKKKECKNLRLVTYILDDNRKKSKVVSDIRGFNFEEEPEQIDLGGSAINEIYSVENWLWNIKSSDFVVTDSFHGMVFSIIFKKQFLVISNKKRGVARFESLLSLLDLQDRLVDEDLEVTKKYFQNKINYELVDFHLDVLRQKSTDFIVKSLL